MGNPFDGMIGIAMRAGKCVLGAYAVENAIRSGAACLVIADETISQGSFKKYQDMCRHANIELITANAPCRAAGKADRMCLAITDRRIAENILKKRSPYRYGG